MNGVFFFICLIFRHNEKINIFIAPFFLPQIATVRNVCQQSKYSQISKVFALYISSPDSHQTNRLPLDSILISYPDALSCSCVQSAFHPTDYPTNLGTILNIFQPITEPGPSIARWKRIFPSFYLPTWSGSLLSTHPESAIGTQSFRTAFPALPDSLPPQ